LYYVLAIFQKNIGRATFFSNIGHISFSAPPDSNATFTLVRFTHYVGSFHKIKQILLLEKTC